MKTRTSTLRRVMRQIGHHWPLMVVSLLLAAVSVALTIISVKKCGNHLLDLTNAY